MGPKERKVREKEQRRDDIISAGEKLFLKKGFPGTTMDEIARECELSKGTLYLYFSSKDELFFTIVLTAMTVMYNLMRDSQEGLKEPVDRIRAIGSAYLNFYDRHPEYFRILSRIMDNEFDLNGENYEIGIRIQQMNSEVWRLMTGIISDGIKEGIFRDDTDPAEICISLYASASMIIQLMDHTKRNHGNMKKMSSGAKADPFADSFFSSLDFRKTLNSCGERIIYSILVNKPDLSHT